jgi:hypothetical protein
MMVSTAGEVVEGSGSAAVDAAAVYGAGGRGGVLFGPTLPSLSTPVKCKDPIDNLVVSASGTYRNFKKYFFQ